MSAFEFPVKDYPKRLVRTLHKPEPSGFVATIAWLLSMVALGFIWVLSLIKLVFGLVFMLPWKLWRFSSACWWTLYWGLMFLVNDDVKIAMAMRRMELRQCKIPERLTELVELVNEFRALGPHGLRNRRYLTKLEEGLRRREREWFLDE